MTFRYEFEEPLEKGHRRVRAYDGDECAMSGILEAQCVNVVPPRVHSWGPMHEDVRIDGCLPVGTSTRMAVERAHKAIDQLVAIVSKSHVFVFVDNCPWSLELVRGFDTEPESDAFMDGVRCVAAEVIAAQWPFTSESLVLRGVNRSDVDALMVAVHERAEDMGLIPAETKR